MVIKIKKISLNKLLKLKNINIIDIRDNNEYDEFRISNSINIPYSELLNNHIYYINKKDKYYIVCETGYTSKQLIKKLSKYNYHFVYVKKGIKKIMNA